MGQNGITCKMIVLSLKFSCVTPGDSAPRGKPSKQEMMKEIESATDDTETGTPHVSVTGSGLTSQHPLFTEGLGKLRTRLLDTSGSQETMLATSGASGTPSLRSISIYDIDDKGILYFANGRSRHATQLRQNRRAALCCSIAETVSRCTGRICSLAALADN